MKKVLFFTLFVCLFICIGCGGDGGGGVKPPRQDDHVSITTNMTIVSEYTYSLSAPPSPPLIVGSIGFAVAVYHRASSNLERSDITWTITGDNVGTLSPVPNGTGAYLDLNNTTGTAVVKATYLEGTIDEMYATVTIHIVP